MRAVLTRLGEMLFACCVLSLIMSTLYRYNFIGSSHTAFCMALLAAFVVFAVCNVFLLRRCYYELREPTLYYAFNYIAYAIFILVSVVVYFIFGETPYAWMFNIFKVLRFADVEMSSLAASAVLHVVMLIVIALAPLGMDWVFEFDGLVEPEGLEKHAEAGDPNAPPEEE